MSSFLTPKNVRASVQIVFIKNDNDERWLNPHASFKVKERPNTRTMQQEETWEMGNRPSRQRRHLPLAVTLAATSRCDSKSKLLKMRFARNNNNKDKAAPLLTKKRCIYIVSGLWILFLLYRVFQCFQKDDYASLSIVHFFRDRMTTQKGANK